MENKKSRLVLDDEEKVNFNEIDEEFSKKKEIPSNYVEIKLPSMGKYGSPKSLHFRDFTFSDVVDLNMTDETGENLCKILTNMNYEKYDISKLSEKDAMVILMTLHKAFVSDSIEKTIHIDDTLEEGTNKGQLDNEDNLEQVDIDILSLTIQNLGYDKDDNLIGNVKFPFTITDSLTNDKIKLRIPILEDVQKAYYYCNEYFQDDMVKFSNIKANISRLQNIKDEDKQNMELEKYYAEHEKECIEYYKFVELVTATTTKLVQAMQIVEFNGKVVETMEEKLKLFNDNISSGVWNKYSEIVEKFNFGIIDEIEVFSQTLNKKVVRKIPFQISDFIPTNERKTSERYDVEFD